MAITHATVKAPGEKVFAVADWNAAHIGDLWETVALITKLKTPTTISTEGKALTFNALHSLWFYDIPLSSRFDLAMPAGYYLSLKTKKIGDLGDPTLPQDAATKKYIDDNIMTEAFIYLYRTDVFDMTNHSTWYDLPFNVASPCKKNVTHDHTSNPEQITLTEAGTYKISWEVHAWKVTISPLISSRLLDDGTEIPGSYRQTAGESTATALLGGSMICFVAADSVIEVQVGCHDDGLDVDWQNNREPDPTTKVVASLSIHKISDDTS